MSSTTTNLNLVKPGYGDAADIADINGNMDILDGAYASINSSIATKETILAKGALVGTSGSTIDLNDYRDTGLYFVTVNSYISHAPVGVDNYGYLEILKMSSGSTLQRFTQYATSGSSVAADTYVRYYTNTQWYDWVLIGGASSFRTDNMIFGGDDIRYRTDSSTLSTDDFPYPFEFVSSTYTDSACALGYNKYGFQWNGSNTYINTERDKYTIFNLGYVPNNFPITVSFLVKAGSYYTSVGHATIQADNTITRVYGSSSTVRFGYVKTSSYDANYKILQWCVGRSNGDSDYDAGYLYGTNDCHVVAVRAEYGTKHHLLTDMTAMLNAKESRYDNYISEKAVGNLTRGDLNPSTNINLNNYTTTGLYYLTINSHVQNAPCDIGTAGYLEIWRMDGTSCLQRFTENGISTSSEGGRTWVRYSVGTTWYAWVGLNDNRTYNMLVGGDDLRQRVSDTDMHSDTPFPISSVSTTYTGNVYPIGYKREGLVWYGSNATINTERDKYATYNLCLIPSGNYPITVTMLLKAGSYYTSNPPMAIITGDSGNFPLMGGSNRTKHLGYIKSVSTSDGNYRQLQWVVGRSATSGGSDYDAEMLYGTSSTYIVSIRVEMGNRVYNVDEMKRLINPHDMRMMEFVNSRVVEGSNFIEYGELMTTNKTITGAINELFGMIG